MATRTGPREAVDAEATSHSGPRLAILTSAESWRGSAVSFIHIAQGLSSRGWLVTVVATCDAVARGFREAGVRAEHLPRDVWESWRLRALLRRARAHVLMPDRPHDLRVGAKATAGGRGRARIVYRYNLSRATVPRDVITRLAYSRLVRATVFLTDSARQRVLAQAPFMRAAPSLVIPEGLDVTEFRPRPRDATEFRRRHGLGEDSFLLAVGALSPEKRYEFVFGALKGLGSSAPPLVICGTGAEEQRLRDLAASLDLRVRFLGQISRAELPGAYSASAALVHGCAVETFGLSVLEAMACGRPVIAVAGGALPEVVGVDGTRGILVDPAAPLEMRDAIAALMQDRPRAESMGAAARVSAVERFSLDAMVSGYASALSRHLPSSHSRMPVA